MRGAFVFLWIILFTSVGFTYPKHPDPEKTPGTLCTRQHPDYHKDRYKARIPYCHRTVSSADKKRIYKQYGIPLKNKRNYTIDHFIPLSIGGSNEDENLWPEHKKVKALRPQLELEVFMAVRDSEITQEEAIDIIIDAKMNPPIQIQ